MMVSVLRVACEFGCDYRARKNGLLSDKHYPSRSGQTSLATAEANFTKPRTSHFFDLCTYLKGFCHRWCSDEVCMGIQYQVKTFWLTSFRHWIKPKMTIVWVMQLFWLCENLSKDPNHSGNLESSIACISSWVLILIRCSWYFPSLNISSAFSLLKEQHIPRSVGCISKIAAQLMGCPFHTHFFIIPVSSFSW